MTGRGSKKRHSSQPLGGEAKDARSEDDNCLGDGNPPTWSQVAATRGGGRGAKGFATANRFGLLAQANSYPDKSMRSASVSSRGSRRGARFGTETGQDFGIGRSQSGDQELTYSESSLGAATRFVTPQPDGAYRDDFAIEFQLLNGKPFRGSITIKEARDVVFKEILGFGPALLHSIRPVFGGTVTIRFKLKEQINLDSLTAVEFFELERKVTPTRTDVISCRIMGIRGMQAAPNFDGTANDVRWVKIENCEYAFEEEEILEWLRLYGQPLSLLGEDMLPDSDSDADPLGNGTYSLKMKLAKDIPQFLPMHGRKIRIYFKNMTKLCTNCYRCHTRRQCTNERVTWVVYVRDFMKANPDIAASYYGKWWDVVDNEFPGYFDQDDPDEQNAQQAEGDVQQRLPEPTSAPTQQPQKPARFAQAKATEEPTRQSRDPRVQKQQQHQRQLQQDELTALMQRGLTMNDAKNYLKNKNEQQEFENRMISPGTSNSGHRGSGHDGSRMSFAKVGPSTSRGGRGGLSFN